MQGIEYSTFFLWQLFQAMLINIGFALVAIQL